ncbi:hypothetical protein [Frondihabitans australicus]|uniref:Uncharacterized protein n=1 Tax=Frondihabitans australicus TaxID=386892 RepID=A0A495IID9_9MICO|nr:hypothetical protein [Frondihabitans australicus]RKR75757.1 hypothetical protein C8E83_2912 [Frondihabitans australicus]
MESRRVTSVEVDEHGHVKRLLNDHGDWSPQTCADVVADMENGVCSYFVSWAGDDLPVQTAHEGSHVRLVARRSPGAIDQLLLLPRAESPVVEHGSPTHQYAHLGD